MHSLYELQLLQDICGHLVAGKEPKDLLPQHLTLYPPPRTVNDVFPRPVSTLAGGSGSATPSAAATASTRMQLTHTDSPAKISPLLLNFHRQTFSLAARRLRQEADRLTQSLQQTEHPFFESFAPQLQQFGHPLFPNMRLPYHCSRHSVHAASIDLRSGLRVNIPERHDGRKSLQVTIDGDIKQRKLCYFQVFTENNDTNERSALAVHRRLIKAQYAAAQESLLHWLLAESQRLHDSVVIQQKTASSIEFQLSSLAVRLAFEDNADADAAPTDADGDNQMEEGADNDSIADWLHWLLEQEYCRNQAALNRLARRRLLPLLETDGSSFSDLPPNVWESIQSRVQTLLNARHINERLRALARGEGDSGGIISQLKCQISLDTFKWQFTRDNRCRYSIQLQNGSHFTVQIRTPDNDSPVIVDNLPGSAAVLQLLEHSETVLYTNK
jgi:hypothetical protein